jgi:ribosomal protein S9
MVTKENEWYQLPEETHVRISDIDVSVEANGFVGQAQSVRMRFESVGDSA